MQVYSLQCHTCTGRALQRGSPASPCCTPGLLAAVAAAAAAAAAVEAATSRWQAQPWRVLERAAAMRCHTP
jgi:hypothetical protein